MSAALLALALAGCVKPLPDPLAAQRGELSWLDAPPQGGWPAHATLVLGRPLLDEAMLAAVTRALDLTPERVSTTTRWPSAKP